MGRIVYTITNGELPITVNLKDEGGVIIDTNIHAVYGTYSFEGIDSGESEYINFTIEFIDSMDCYESEIINQCINCPDGYYPAGDKCIYYDETSPTFTSPTFTVVKKSPDNSYGFSGPLLFSSWNYDGTGVYERFNLDGTYWRNLGSATGPMNRSAVWASTTYNNQDIGFSFCVNIAVAKTYYIGFGADNWGKIKLNGQFILEQDITALGVMFTNNGDPTGGGDILRVTHAYWYIYPVQLPAGQNIIEVFGHNVDHVAAIGIQIYDATPVDFYNSSTTNPLTDEIIFSSESLNGDTLQYEYSSANGYHGYYCEPGYALDTCGETVKCVKRVELDCGEEPPTTTTTTTTVEEFLIASSFSPAVIRNIEGDNITPTYANTMLYITDINGTDITLNYLPQNLFKTGVSWYLQSLDDNSQGDIDITGDYTTHTKVVSFDWSNKIVTVTSAANLSIGENIYFYSPFTNYEFLPGQTTAPYITNSGTGWRSIFVNNGATWWDSINSRYIMLVNGRGSNSKFQIGYAHSTNLTSWTIGNSDNPIILNTDSTDFANHVYSTSKAVNLGNGSFGLLLTGYDSSNNKSIYYCEITEDLSNINIASSKLLARTDLMAPDIHYFGGQYHILAHRRNATLQLSTIEHWSSNSIDNGYTQVSEFGSEWNDNDSVWLEGWSDSFCIFEENNNLYSLTFGTSRYRVSGTRADRVLGLLKYNTSTQDWEIVNNFAPEIIAPMYFQDMGEPYGIWAGSHAGGYPTILKENGECYIFISFERVSDSYGIGVIKLIGNPINI